MKRESNFFDDLNSGFDLSEALRQRKDSTERAKKLDYLIHKTFEQNQAGKDLLAIWKESLLMQPSATGGMDLVDIGIREGQKRFIRGIILTVNRVERGDV